MMLQEQQLDGVGNGKSLALSSQQVFPHKVVTDAITENNKQRKTQHLYFKEMNYELQHLKQCSEAKSPEELWLGLLSHPGR